MGFFVYTERKCINHMKKVKVIYYGMIWHKIGHHEEQVNLSDQATVRELVHLLVGKYGDKFRDNCLTPDFELRPLTKIHLNGRDINEIDGLDTRLDDNSEVFIALLLVLGRAG